MSREVRRVPLDYKHPTIPNPHWEHHLRSRLREGIGSFRLHNNDERFIPLRPGYMFEEIQKEIAEEKESLLARSGSHWEYCVEYYLTGHKWRQNTHAEIHPYLIIDKNDWSEILIKVTDEDHLQKLLLDDIRERESNLSKDKFMPSFEEYEPDELGYCLYQTVSEGTPVTPVFATAEELIDYLVDYGTESNAPFRREAAESLVEMGFSIGSFFVKNNTVHNSAEDADKL